MDFEKRKEHQLYWLLGQICGLLQEDVMHDIADGNMLHLEHLKSLVFAAKNCAFYAYGEGAGQVRMDDLAGVTHAQI